MPAGVAPILSGDNREFVYQPEPDEWSLQAQDLFCRRMIQYLDQLIFSPIAENFVRLVDINKYPNYANVVPYPIELFTIRARLENKFYRRITALKFDLRYLRNNAKIFNESNSEIIKQASIVTDICLDIIKYVTLILNNDINITFI